MHQVTGCHRDGNYNKLHTCQPFDAHCCHMDTPIKHPVTDRVLSVRVPGCQKLQMTA